MTRTLWLLSLALCAATAARSDDPPVRRGDVALALVRFEAAFDPLVDAAERARINRAFDRATVAYFAGDARGTLRQLDALTLECLGLADDPAARAAIRLRVRVTPPRGAGGPRTVTAVPLYAAGDDAPVALGSDAPGFEPLRVRPGEEAPLGVAPVGTHALWLELRGGVRLEACAWAVCEGDLDELRTSLLARLDRLGDRAPARALDCARARAGLLRATPDEEETAQLFLDPVATARELAAEVEALEAGRDPYRRRAGEQWRALRLDGGLLPYRVSAPAADERRRPLLIALHGFKGDESMFRWAYGRGRLFDLARQEGWLVCTPRTEPLLRSPPALEALVGALAEDYPVDRERIVLLGHSMGSQAVSLLLRDGRVKVAGAVLFAGAAPDAKVPTLAIRGALDPLGGFGARAQEGAREGWGHTLLVGPHLEEALAFLREALPRRRYY